MVTGCDWLVQLLIMFRNAGVGENEDVAVLLVQTASYLGLAVYCWLGKTFPEVWCDRRQLWKLVVTLLCCCGYLFAIQIVFRKEKGIHSGFIFAGILCSVLLFVFAVPVSLPPSLRPSPTPPKELKTKIYYHAHSVILPLATTPPRASPTGPESACFSASRLSCSDHARECKKN